MIFIIVSCLLGFLTVLVTTPFAEKYLAASGIYGKDQQKPGKPSLPTSGGLIVLLGFLITLTFYSGLNSLFSDQFIDRELLFASISSAALIALVGLIDDINIDYNGLFKPSEVDLEVDIVTSNTIIHEKADIIFGSENSEEARTGLSQSVKMLMVLPAALPLIAAGAGSWTMIIPLIGRIEWGLLYPLVLLPIGLLFVSNVVNMLAGTNGLAAGMSFVTSLGLGIFGLLNNQFEAAIIAFSLAAPLAGFLIYNMYPSSILPGDSLTYLCGAVMFSAMVVGDMEKFGVFIFMLYFVEFFLKARSGFKADSWGVLQSDGGLVPRHAKNYSLTHPLMRKGFNEKQITLLLVGLQTLIVVFGLFVFQMFSV